MKVEIQGKGVGNAVKKTLNHNIFKGCLLSKNSVSKKMTQLRSVNHQGLVRSVEKVALTSFDDKLYLLVDGIPSLAYGHYAIPESAEGNIYSFLTIKKNVEILLSANLAYSTSSDDSGPKSESESSASTSEESLSDCDDRDSFLSSSSRSSSSELSSFQLLH